jgi:hypothetical protein
VSGFKLFVNGTTDTRVFDSLGQIAPHVAAAFLRGDEWDVRHDLGTAPLNGDETDTLIARVETEVRMVSS